MRTGNHIVCLDFDGTIVDSAESKLRAFKKLFSQLPSKKFKLAEEILDNNQGIPRNIKFKRIYTEVLKKEITDNLLKELSDSLDKLIMQDGEEIKLLGNIKDFCKIYNTQIIFYITSAAPRQEIINKLKKTELINFFEKIYGSNIKKEEAISKIVKKHKANNKYIYMIGDTYNDLIAARAGGAEFIGFGSSAELKKCSIRLIDDFFELENILMLNDSTKKDLI